MPAISAGRIQVSDHTGDSGWQGRCCGKAWDLGTKFSTFPRANTAYGHWQADHYVRNDEHEDKLNRFPLRSQLQSQWPVREAKISIGHLVEMIEH